MGFSKKIKKNKKLYNFICFLLIYLIFILLLLISAKIIDYFNKNNVSSLNKNINYTNFKKNSILPEQINTYKYLSPKNSLNNFDPSNIVNQINDIPPPLNNVYDIDYNI